MAPFHHKLAPMMRRLVTSLAIVCALLAVAPVVAAGQTSGSAQQALTDCNNHGTLTGHYSPDALRNALASMPADMREYTDCYDVIEKQLFAQLGTSSSGGSGGSGSGSGGSVLPTWLIVVIVVLALAALTFGALAIRRRRLEMNDGADGGAPDGGGPGPSAPGQGGPSEPESPPTQRQSDDPGGSGPSGGS
jgi:hypothetical protein